MKLILEVAVVLVLFAGAIFAGELTFELPDNERQCFFEVIDRGVECSIEFQVITGGHYDVDMELTDPNGKSLYKEVKKQYDSFVWTTDTKGVHKICFSNEFSTITHKVVYMDFQVGDEEPIIQNMDAHATAMTMMETTSQSIHNLMKDVLDRQTHFKLRETQGRAFAEDLNQRVMFWSIGESILVFIIGLGQVLVLRSFFTDKKSSGITLH